MSNDRKKSWLPKRFLWRLTFLNIVIVASFIVLSSWAIYNTACFLVDGMEAMDVQKLNQFDSTLFQYLWIFSVTAIVMGSIVHFYLTRTLTRPLRGLIESTKSMKKGQYPTPIEVSSEDEIGQLSVQFNSLVQQLKNNEQYRQKLISDLSHEFRTPLSNLNGYLNAMKNGVIEGDQKLYESLHEESKRLISMVEQLEKLKEWDSVSQQLFSDKKVVDMALLMEQSVEMFRWTMEKADIEVGCKVENGLVNVYNGGITQVLSNLLDNAVRYYRGTGPITITGECLDREYRVCISGPGQEIPETEQDKIFERFYRTDPSRSRETGGTGLGLAITKEIVKSHHGEIGVHSNGNEHTFWFTLPLHAVSATNDKNEC
ncbi:sensor histidine kinase [Priestia taiwanensis]|nr:HAMP domain-containing sensor histidine kinase [Priestia taiwanensis]MBM7365054.1 two-component system sensor histidine kinase BaeS [Priestia taiwanensis]